MNELTMNLEPHSAVPLYEQIYRYIKSDIQKGRISAGEKLPSTRSLAKYLYFMHSQIGMHEVCTTSCIPILHAFPALPIWECMEYP